MKDVYLRSEPTDKQRLLFRCPADEILYGGALGGGKSWAAVLKGYELAINNKNIRIGIFRRSLQELENTIVREAQDNYIVGTYKYVPSKRRFEFPSKSRILLGFIDTDRDLTQYQGQEYDVIILDEATNFTEYQMVYLKSRLRSSSGFRTRIYYLTNPTGVGKAYLKRRFIDNKIPYKLYKTPETENIPTEGEYRNGILVKPRYGVFIPAKLQDNKHLIDKDPLYMDALNELPEELRKALLDGDWDNQLGTFFPMYERKRHVIPTYTPTKDDQLFIGADWGTNKPFAIGWFALRPNNQMIMYREYYGTRPGSIDTGLELTATEVAKNIIDRCPKEESYRYMVLDTQCWAKDSSGGSVYEQMQEILKARKITIIKANKDRVNGMNNVKNWLVSKTLDTEEPTLLFTKSCYHITRIFPDLVYHYTRQGHIADNQEDHLIDMLNYVLASRPYKKMSPSKQGYANNQWGRYMEKAFPELV